VSGLCQQYVSSRLSRTLVPCVGVLQVVAGTAGGVGESSGIERLTDVPEFRRVLHRRKTFAECLVDEYSELLLYRVLGSSHLHCSDGIMH
jgi:hypothetical protein